jgi:hypothetical protein
MDEEPERWTIHELDDRAAQVTRSGDRPTLARTRTKVAAALALAALVMVGIVLVAGPSRTGVAEPTKTPEPTFSRNDSGTPLSSEAETWGAIWSRAQGVAVLRPTWLPKSKDEYQVVPGGGGSRDGFVGYDVLYLEVRPAPGRTVWTVELFADSLETEGRGFIQFAGVPETVMVRGHSAQLTGNGSPGWVLVWTEGNYRYAIQALATSREDLLRMAESLAPVIDDKGGTR